MNWDEMPAGPEMDRTVAEMVMRWKPSRRPYYCDAEGERFVVGGSECGECGSDYGWSPSTDLDAAVAACGRRAWAVESNDPDVAYCATVEGHEEIAQTPALALCRALLKAAS